MRRKSVIFGGVVSTVAFIVALAVLVELGWPTIAATWNWTMHVQQEAKRDRTEKEYHEKINQLRRSKRKFDPFGKQTFQSETRK